MITITTTSGTLQVIPKPRWWQLWLWPEYLSATKVVFSSSGNTVYRVRGTLV